MSGTDERHVDLLWEAAALVNAGHDVTGRDVRRTAGVKDETGAFDHAVAALDLLREAAPPEVVDLLAPGDLLGGYRIETTIGRGGMGVVYEATGEDGESVALKVLNPILAADLGAVLRFKQEATVAGRLRHPNLAAVFDAGEEGELVFFVMERVRGEALHVRLGSDDPPNGPEVRAWAGRFAGVARALQHAHDNGVIHRDVKPSNVLADEDGTLRLVDFGIARPAEAATLTASSMLLGTPLYMSPEQAAGRRDAVGPATDIYSLGATIFEVATGRPTIDPDTDARAVIHSILETVPPRPTRLNPAVPRDLETVLLRALEKRPADRYASAAEFAADLERIAGREPITAKRPGMIRTIVRGARRRPTVALWVLCGLLFAVALGAVLLRGGRPRETWPELSRRAWINYPSNISSRRWRAVGIALDRYAPQTEPEREERVVLRVWRALKEGGGAAAIRILDEAGSIPSARAFVLLRGTALYRSWRIPESEPLFKRARAMPSETLLDRILWAHHRLGLGADAENARAELDALVKEAPDSLPAHMVHIAALRAGREFDRALEVCGILKIIGLDDPAVEVLRAAILNEKGDVDASIASFRSAIAREPQNDVLRAQFIYMLQNRGRSTLAAREVAAGLEAIPDSEWLLNLRGWAHHRAKRFDEAIADYRKALKNAPHFSYSQVNLGDALIASGGEAEGIAAWQDMLDDESLPARNRASIHQSLAVHYWQTGNAAKTTEHTRLSLDALYTPAAHGNLIFYLMNEDRNGEALDEAERLLRLTPNDWATLARRGICKMHTYDLAGAAKDLGRAADQWRGEPPKWVVCHGLIAQGLIEDPDLVATRFESFRERFASGEGGQFRYVWIDFLFRWKGATAEVRKLIDEFYRIDGADDERWIDAIDVQLVGREQGWRAAVDRWQTRGIAKMPDAELDGRFALLRLAVEGAEQTDASAPRGHCRALLEGTPLVLAEFAGSGDLRSASAWLVGRRLLDAGAAEAAIPYLTTAADDVRLGACHLDLACALAVARGEGAALPSLRLALARKLPTLYAAKRLHRFGVEPTAAIRAPFLADDSSTAVR